MNTTKRETSHKPTLTVSIQEAADLIGVSYESIMAAVKAGEIPHVRIGKLHRIRRDLLETFVFGGAIPNGAKVSDIAGCNAA